MAITGGNFARPGERGDGGELSAEKLKALLSDDIQDLELKGELEKQDVLKGLSDAELSLIMDRERLFLPRSVAADTPRPSHARTACLACSSLLTPSRPRFNVDVTQDFAPSSARVTTGPTRMQFRRRASPIICCSIRATQVACSAPWNESRTTCEFFLELGPGNNTRRPLACRPFFCARICPWTCI